jgi:hypothetical protein
MLAFGLGFVVGLLTAILLPVLACRAVRRRRVLQQAVDAGARRDIPVAPGSPMAWQEAQERLAVLRWRPAHWQKPWPEA